METVVTSRIDSDLKDKAVGILQQRGLTASDAIRQMFEQVAINNDVQFLTAERVDFAKAKEKIARIDSIYVRGFEDATDEDLKRARLEDRYATVSGH